MEFGEEQYQSFPVENSEENNAVEGMQYAETQEETGAVEYKEPAQPMFRNVIRWLVYAVVFLVPLWFLPFTADVREFNKQILLIIAASLGLVLYLVDIIKSGVVRYKPSSFYFPVFGLVGAGVISVIFSVNRMASLFGVGESRAAALITMTSLAVIFFLAVNIVEDKGKMLKKVMTASLALAFLFGILQIFGVYLFRGAGFASRAFNSVGSINMIGLLAAMSLAFFTSPGRNREDETESGWFVRAVRVLRYVGLVSAIFLAVLINWWPVWTVAFISLMASVALASASDASLVKNGRMRLFALPMALIVLGIFLMMINFNWTALKSKLPVEVAPAQRTSWGIALRSLKSRPLGHGAENFVIAYDKYKPSSIANTIFYQVRFGDATSEAANAAVEGGIPMVLAVLALLWFYGKELFGSVKRGFYGNKEAGAIWASSIGLLVAYFLYPFNTTAMTLLFLLLALGLISTSQREERVIDLESDAKYSFLGSLAFIAGLVLVLVAGYFSANNYIANAFLAKATKSSDPTKAIEYYVESANGNPSDARTYRLLSQTIVKQLANDLRNGSKKDESREDYNARVQNEIASAVNIALRATTADPADSQNWVNRGLVYENLLTLVGGADQAAINTYNESLARNPADPNTYLRIGNVHLAVAESLQRAVSRGQAGADVGAVRRQIDENLTGAAESYNKAVALYNNFGQALYNLAVVYDRQNKLPDAIKQFEKLRAGNSRDPSMAFQIGLLYYRNNQKDAAFNAWQQAVVLFPSYSNARWYLSLVYEERGDLANALKQVEEIERFNPDSEMVRERLDKLRSGKRTIPPEKVLDQKPL